VPIKSLTFDETPRKPAATLVPEYESTVNSNADTRVCVTPTCQNASVNILLSLSPDYKKIDPCIDFEELVCGGWNQNHVLNSDEPMTVASVFTELENKVLAIQREILEGPYPIMGDSSAIDRENFDKIKVAYHACMNENITPKAGAESLTKILNEIVRLYPAEAPTLLDNVSIETQERDEIANVMTFLSKFYVSTLLDLEPGRNIKDPVSKILLPLLCSLSTGASIAKPSTLIIGLGEINSVCSSACTRTSKRGRLSGLRGCPKTRIRNRRNIRATLSQKKYEINV
jgi:Peptidase family M13